MKSYLKRLWQKARTKNTDKLLDLLEPNPKARLLDLGCNDGTLTKQYAKRVGTDAVYGIDLDPVALKAAKRRGVRTRRADVGRRLPYPANHFDVVVTNQVIEHLFEPDRFVMEIFRILKPGGYAAVSTDNLASWHNVFALSLGWPAFSQHVSSQRDVGNPLSLVSGERLPDRPHVKIFTLRGLVALLELHHFTVEATRGSGYYPLPALLANQVSRLSPGHSAFITAKVRKPQR